MTELAVNVELLYADLADDIGDRIRLAAEDGVRFADLWYSSDKNLPSIRDALRDTGIILWSMVVEPRTSLSTVSDLADFVDAVRRSADRANAIGCRNLVVSSEEGTPARKRAEQHTRVAEALSLAGQALEGSGITLLLENVNTRVDHPGALLDLVTDCVAVLEEAQAPNVALLADLYHAFTMGEPLHAILPTAAPWIGHVQIAGVPGRAEPSLGSVAWAPVVAAVRAAGYDGPIGLEYFPTLPTRESLAASRSCFS